MNNPTATNYQLKQLWRSRTTQGGCKIEHLYYLEADTLTIHASYVSHQETDQHSIIFYNDQGEKTHSIRNEAVSELHVRRYYNDTLIYEGIKSRNEAHTPSSYRYFYPNGRILIDYTAHDDETATWYKYDTDGKTVASITGLRVWNRYDESSIKAQLSSELYERWDLFLYYYQGDVFLPFIPLDYPRNPEKNDWEMIDEQFAFYHRKAITLKKLWEMPMPAELQAELNTLDWQQVSGTGEAYGMKDLPLAIKGMFSEDREVAFLAAYNIWCEGCLGVDDEPHEALYRCAIMVARMLPHHTSLAPVRRHVYHFLTEVLSLPYIYLWPSLHEELLTTIQQAFANNPLTTRQADTLSPLALLYRHMPPPEAGDPPMQVPGDIYAAPVQRDNAILTQPDLHLLALIFAQEQDPFIRLAFASRLTAHADPAVAVAAISELIRYLIEPDGATMLFAGYAAITKSNDKHSFVNASLKQAERGAWEQYMDQGLALLSSADKAQQTILLAVLFEGLFPGGSDLSHLSAVQQRLLSAAAVVVTTHHYCPEHSEVFRAYGLPYHAEQLRQLSGN